MVFIRNVTDKEVILRVTGRTFRFPPSNPIEVSDDDFVVIKDHVESLHGHLIVDQPPTLPPPVSSPVTPTSSSEEELVITEE